MVILSSVLKNTTSYSHDGSSPLLLHFPERWHDSFLLLSCGISGLTTFNLNISDSGFVAPTVSQEHLERFVLHYVNVDAQDTIEADHARLCSCTYPPSAC
ncbi:unnamed protein product [Alopecurus aequalis]